MQLDLIRITHI